MGTLTTSRTESLATLEPVSAALADTSPPQRTPRLEYTAVREKGPAEGTTHIYGGQDVPGHLTPDGVNRWAWDLVRGMVDAEGTWRVSIQLVGHPHLERKLLAESRGGILYRRWLTH